MRVLVVEDERKLATTIAVGLRREGMAVDIAFDGRDGLHRALRESYDVTVLDRDLPELHGDEVCRAIVARGERTRVLMLTASGTVADRVNGLGLGADDYLAKPFDFPELVARIRALARRSCPALPPVLDQRGHPPRHRASGSRAEAADGSRSAGKSSPCSSCCSPPKERPSLHAQLRARAWDEHTGRYSDVVKVTISRLRRKLGDPPVIETVPNAGYRLKP